MKSMQVGIALVLVAIAFAAGNGLRHSGGANSVAGEPAAAAASPLEVPAQKPLAAKPRLAVAFLLDPELTSGMFMGDRWVSPATYFFAQEGPQFVVRAKLQEIDGRGQHIDLSGDWSVDAPDMLAVIPRGHGEVTITIRKPGEGRITVATTTGAKLLQVRAKQVESAMQVRITQ